MEHGMKQSKNWLKEARSLCAEPGPEDGIDPRIIARAMNRKPRGHKSEQLSKQALHTLSMVFAGELTDPVFGELEILDVTTSDDGQFLTVTFSVSDPELLPAESLILEKCNSIEGYLRSTIARSVQRKRIPALKFKIVLVENKENSYAYSKNNQ
jgi:ribosome-binding factor A